MPAGNIGTMHLVGRLSSTQLTAFIYSSQIKMLVEPVMSYLLHTTWVGADSEGLVNFLLGSVRMAIPEGLLGFFKTQGALSRESVLGRLGFAAVIAFLNQENVRHLIVSLDTEGARRWLGLRDLSGRRADMLVMRFEDGKWLVDAVEVKARSDGGSWAGGLPEAVVEAIQQVSEMRRLLLQMFAG